MARTRLLHPDAPLDEDVASLGPCARLVWAYLPCHADRAGRLADKPFTLKLVILPTDDVDMDTILDELAARDLIQRYQVDGRRFIQIRSFLRYQHPHRNESESEIPLAPEGKPRDTGNTGALSKDRSPSVQGPTHSGCDDPVSDTVMTSCQHPSRNESESEIPLAPKGKPPAPENTVVPSKDRSTSVQGPMRSGGDDPVSDTVMIREKKVSEDRNLCPPAGDGVVDGSHPPAVNGSTDAEGAAIRAVFDCYRELHPRAFRKPSSKSTEWRKIRERFREGSTVEDLCTAIAGYHRSPFHLGENERGQSYLALELIVRDGSHVAKGIEYANQRAGPVLSEREAKGVRASVSWLERSRGKNQEDTDAGP